MSEPKGEEGRLDIRAIEPGVDEGAARSTKAAGPASLRDAGLTASAPSEGEALNPSAAARLSARRGLWVGVGVGIAVVAIAVFALLVPLTPALAWIGIALQVALAAMLIASALGLPAGRYRGSRFAWITGFQALSAVVLLLIILLVVWVT